MSDREAAELLLVGASLFDANMRGEMLKMSLSGAIPSKIASDLVAGEKVELVRLLGKNDGESLKDALVRRVREYSDDDRLAAALKKVERVAELARINRHRKDTVWTCDVVLAAIEELKAVQGE